MTFEGLVRVGYISLVMFVVVDFHRFGVDVWLERVERIG